MVKPLNIEAEVKDAIATAPEIDVKKAERAREANISAPVAGTPAATAQIYTDDVAARHGRVAARALGVGFKQVVGEDLDSDVTYTTGEVLGEMMGLVSRYGSREIYFAILGITVLPVMAAIGLKAWRTWKEIKTGEKA
jgi:hypothetical protein